MVDRSANRTSPGPDTEPGTPVDGLERKIVLYQALAWAAVVLGLLLPFVVGHLDYVDRIRGANEMGDLIAGTAGPVLALAGLLFVYVAFLGQRQALSLQRRELSLTRDEMELTRKELEGQRRAMAEQAKAAREQTRLMQVQRSMMETEQYESTLFRLLAGMRESLAGAAIGRTVTHGDHAPQWIVHNGTLAYLRLLIELYDEFKPLVSDLNRKIEGLRSSPDDRRALAEQIADVYRTVVLERSPDPIDLLCQQLRSALDFAARANASEHERDGYASIVVDQLTDSHLCLLWFHVATSQADERLVKLVERFGVLGQVDAHDLPSPYLAEVLGVR